MSNTKSKLKMSNNHPPPEKKRMRPLQKGRKLSEFERYRLKKQRQKKLQMLLGVAVMTSAVIGAIVGISGLTGKGPFSSSDASVSQFPRPLVGSSVRQIEPLGWNIALLDNSDLSVYNNKGEATLKFNHGYASPVLETDGNRLLLYDQGGTKFVVASPTHIISDGVAPAAIHAADICQNGTFALITSSTKNATLATFYDPYGNKGTWSSSDMATSIALSPDGKQAAVSLLSTENGALVTSIVLHNLSGGEAFEPVKIREEFGLQLTFKQQSISLITDQSVKQIDFSGKIRNSFEYGGKQVLQFAEDGKSHTAIVLGGNRYMRGNEIIMLDEKCNKLGSYSTDTGIKMLRANDQGVFFLSDGIIQHCDYNAKFAPPVSIPGVIQFTPLGQELYAATYEDLRKVPVP